MKMTLKRKRFTDQSTIGELYINDMKMCDTLEDVVRAPGVKVFGKTAIPPGAYPVIVTHSPHFGRDLPLIQNVPGFEGVRIHPGNTAADTEGCVLVGQADANMPNWIGSSRASFDVLYPHVLDACSKGQVMLVIEEDREHDQPQADVKPRRVVKENLDA